MFKKISLVSTDGENFLGLVYKKKNYPDAKIMQILFN